MTFIDNGDTRVFLNSQTSNKHLVSMTCDKFIPCLKDCPLMLAGTGSSVLLK